MDYTRYFAKVGILLSIRGPILWQKLEALGGGLMPKAGPGGTRKDKHSKLLNLT